MKNLFAWTALATGVAVAGAALATDTTVVLEPGEDYLAATGDPDYGEYLGAECVGCHKINYYEGGIPPINGHDAEWFITMMWEYKYGVRDNPAMVNIAKRLNAEELASLAIYYGAIEAE